MATVLAPAIRVRRIAVLDSLVGRDMRLLIAGARCVYAGPISECWHSTAHGAFRVRSLAGAAELSFIPSGTSGGGIEIFGSVPDAMLACVTVGVGVETPHLVVEARSTKFEIAGAVVTLQAFTKMDPVVEVAGFPGGVDTAMRALGLPSSMYTDATLPELVTRFEAGRRHKSDSAGARL